MTKTLYTFFIDYKILMLSLYFVYAINEVCIYAS